MLSITVRKRAKDYTANVTGDTRIWDAGRSEEEAIGRLVVSLDAAARAKKGIGAVLAWAYHLLVGRTHIRVERLS